MDNSKIRILVVEDELLIAEDIRECLTGNDYEVTGIATNADEALSSLNNNLPDLVLLDINLNGEKDGIDLAEILNEKHLIPFVYLTSYADRVTVERAKHTRPYAYILKPFREEDLYTTLEVALFNYGERNKPRELTLERVNKKILSDLTPREFEVLLNIFDGMNNKQMAEKHFISLNTVKTHIKHIYEKLDINSRSEAVIKLRQIID